MDGYSWNYDYSQAQSPYVYPDYAVDNQPVDLHPHMAHQMPPPQMPPPHFHPEMPPHMPPQPHPQMPPPQMDMPPQMQPTFSYDEMPPQIHSTFTYDEKPPQQMQMPPQIQPNFTHEPVNHPFNTLNTPVPGASFMPSENGYSAPPFFEQPQYQSQHQIPNERVYGPNNPSNMGPWLQSPQVPNFTGYSDTNGQVYEQERLVYPIPPELSQHDEYYSHFPPEPHKTGSKRNTRMRSRSLNNSEEPATSRLNVLRERRPPPTSHRGFDKIRDKHFEEISGRVPLAHASESRSDQGFQQRYRSESPNRNPNQLHRSPRRNHEPRSEIRDEYSDSRKDYIHNIDDKYDARNLNREHTHQSTAFSRTAAINSSREKERLQKERGEKNRDLLADQRRQRDRAVRRSASEKSGSDEEFRLKRHASTRDPVTTKSFNPMDTLDLSSLRQALNAAVKENGHNGLKTRKPNVTHENRQPRVVSPPREKHDEKPVKGILRQPRDKFPEDYDTDVEDAVLAKSSKRNPIPYDARWTKISRRVVNPEALDYGEERYEARQEFVIVLRVLTKEVIQAYANLTHQIRELRDRDERAQATKFANLQARSDLYRGKRNNIRQPERHSIYDEYDSDSYFESEEDYISDHGITNMRGRNMNTAGYLPYNTHSLGGKKHSMKNDTG